MKSKKSQLKSPKAEFFKTNSYEVQIQIYYFLWSLIRARSKFAKLGIELHKWWFIASTRAMKESYLINRQSEKIEAEDYREVFVETRSEFSKEHPWLERHGFVLASEIDLTDWLYNKGRTYFANRKETSVTMLTAMLTACRGFKKDPTVVAKMSKKTLDRIQAEEEMKTKEMIRLFDEISTGNCGVLVMTCELVKGIETEFASFVEFMKRGVCYLDWRVPTTILSVPVPQITQKLQTNSGGQLSSIIGHSICCAITESIKVYEQMLRQHFIDNGVLSINGYPLSIYLDKLFGPLRLTDKAIGTSELLNFTRRFQYIAQTQLSNEEALTSDDEKIRWIGKILAEADLQSNEESNQLETKLTKESHGR